MDEDCCEIHRRHLVRVRLRSHLSTTEGWHQHDTWQFLLIPNSNFNLSELVRSCSVSKQKNEESRVLLLGATPLAQLRLQLLRAELTLLSATSQLSGSCSCDWCCVSFYFYCARSAAAADFQLSAVTSPDCSSPSAGPRWASPDKFENARQFTSTQSHRADLVWACWSLALR